MVKLASKVGSVVDTAGQLDNGMSGPLWNAVTRTMVRVPLWSVIVKTQLTDHCDVRTGYVTDFKLPQHYIDQRTSKANTTQTPHSVIATMICSSGRSYRYSEPTRP